MTLNDKLQSDLKEALKARDENASLTLRSLLSEIKNRSIELKRHDAGLTDEEIQEVFLRELKKRKEALTQYKQANRQDLAKQEEREAEILYRYAPKQIEETELKEVIDGIIKKIGTPNTQNLGNVMKEVMSVVKNKADGSLVSRLVREQLEKND